MISCMIIFSFLIIVFFKQATRNDLEGGRDD